MPDLLNEAAAFFRQDVGYERLFTGLIEKYRSLGRLGGTVRLERLTSREQEVLSAFFRRDYHGHDIAIISVSEMAQALEQTRFAGIELKALLDAYAGETILSKAEATGLYEYRKEQYFIGLKGEFYHPYCWLWLDSILRKETGTRGIHRAYDQDSDGLYQVLVNVLKALEEAPLQVEVEVAAEAGPATGGSECGAGGGRGQGAGRAIYERLPVFASRITGDPHAFDIGKDAGRFLVAALQIIRSKQDMGYEILSSPSAEEITELLDHFGLVRDDLLNFVTCTGILGYSSEKDPLRLWQAALEAGCVLNVPLREMVKAHACRPGKWRDRTCQEGDRVFVVENSGVFSAILDTFTGAKMLPPMVCTHGQSTLATLLLLDKLAKNSILLYSGDFDPEGLQMAQRLIQRYRGRIRLWRYTEEDYELAISQVRLSPRRLGKLGSIKVHELLPVAEVLRQRGRAGYQEALLDRLIEDVREYVH